MKHLCLIIANMLLAVLPSLSESEPSLEVEAENVLRDASDFRLHFGTGFDAQASRESIALLVILGSDNAVKRFSELTKIRGVPSLYGLVGLRLSDASREVFDRRANEVLKRDGRLKVAVSSFDNIDEELVGKLISVSESRKELPIINHGQYAATVFSGLKIEPADYVISNGLLAERIVNPYFRISLFKKDALGADPELLKEFEMAERVVQGNLIFKDPRAILKMLGLKTEDEIRGKLKK